MTLQQVLGNEYERVTFYTVTQGVTNSVSFNASTLTVEFAANGFAKQRAHLWSDALVFIDYLRAAYVQYRADGIVTRALVDDTITRWLKFPKKSGTLATEEKAQEMIDMRMPAPPTSGTFVLKVVDGAARWVAE